MTNNKINFFLNGSSVEYEVTNPQETILEFLRNKRKLIGTKEGCAEGDCGACTAVIIETHEKEPLIYKAINTCISFVATLHNKHLITVEHLQEKQGALHPVQQAMVKHHGSQCGFCTPGFIMSLFALYHTKEAETKTVSDGEIESALVGNLCRCTGYKPILNAARDAYATYSEDVFKKQERELYTQLIELGKESIKIETTQGNFYSPVTEAEFTELLEAHPKAIILAGGTDVGLWVTKLYKKLNTIIYISRIESLSYIEEKENTIEIGAGTLLSDCLPPITKHFSDFSRLLHRFASQQIRNLATLGGNIANASPIGDTMPVLLSLDASLVLRKGNIMRTIPLVDFFIDYRKTALQEGEYLRSIIIPYLQHKVLKVYKISKRADQDISSVCFAMTFQLENSIISSVRIGLGGMAAIPKRAYKTEAYLENKVFTKETVIAAQSILHDEFQPLSDMRGTSQYRAKVTSHLLLKVYYEIQTQQSINIFSTFAE